MSSFDAMRHTGNPALQPGRSPADAPLQSRAVSYPARPTLNPTPGAGGGMPGGGNLPGSVAPGGDQMGLPPSTMPGAFAPPPEGMPMTANPAVGNNPMFGPQMGAGGAPGGSSAPGGAFGAPSALPQLGTTGLGSNSQGGMTFGGGASGFGRGLTGGRGMVGASGGFGRRG